MICGDVFLVADFDRAAESWPSEIQWQRAASGSISARGLFLDSDGDHFEAGLARGFERENGETSVAGDQSRSACYLMKPRSDGANELEQFVDFGRRLHFRGDAFARPARY